MKLHLIGVSRYAFMQGSYCATVLVFAQSTNHKCAENTKLRSLLLFIYYVFSWVFWFFKQKHESIVHLACQFMHLLCIFRTRRGADFFRQFVSGSGSFQVQQKVSWELLEKREKARMKRGWGRAFYILDIFWYVNMVNEVCCCTWNWWQVF